MFTAHLKHLKPVFKTLTTLTALACLLAAPALVHAAVVSEIDVAYEGPATVSKQAILAHVRQAEGVAYSAADIDRSIQSLYATGHYDFIQVRRDERPGGNMRIVFVVSPKHRITEVVYVGNDELSTRKLNNQHDIEPGEPLNEAAIKRATDTLRAYYQKKGYPNATVAYALEKDLEAGTGSITFNIDEGTRTKIADLKFTGNQNVSVNDLEDATQTSERGLLSFITGKGRFDEKQFEDDLETLRTLYKNKGYLDVKIAEEAVTFTYPKPGHMRIQIAIEEGTQYAIGSIALEGNTLYTTEELLAKFPESIATGKPFSPEGIDSTAQRLRDVYGSAGYLDTRVLAQRTPNTTTGAIDVNFLIKESEQFEVGSIAVQGNTKTKSIVILRELALAPGDVFDLVRMRTSEARLRNTSFFEQVVLSPEPTAEDGVRNLRVAVQEGRTGNLSFGAGFSSVERAVVFAEVTQGNFDLFNHRSFFQGDGQKFRLRLSLGSDSNQILLAFEEPWVFERELTFGFEAFRTETDYNSSLYDELRTGFEVYLRKRLFELVEGRLSYRLENVEIFDIDDDASTAIFEQEGESLISKVGFSMLRDTRDSVMLPTTGNRLQAITEIAGGAFGGDADYVRLEGRGAQWWPTFRTRKQVFQIAGRIGSVIPYGDSNTVPFFDRYYLGGPNTLRGFDYREVGPKDAREEPIGGHSFTYLTTEYSFELVDPVRFALFYDWGFVNSDDGDFDPSDYNDNWGFGFRVAIFGAPLRLDFGFPITSDAVNDDGMQFNFSFGTVF